MSKELIPLTVNSTTSLELIQELFKEKFGLDMPLELLHAVYSADVKGNIKHANESMPDLLREVVETMPDDILSEMESDFLEMTLRKHLQKNYCEIAFLKGLYNLLDPNKSFVKRLGLVE